jgi:hypothetical protein
MEPTSIAYITELLRLLECCWHTALNLEFLHLQAHSNIRGIERLPPEGDECNIFLGLYISSSNFVSQTDVFEHTNLWKRDYVKVVDILCICNKCYIKL